ncbi:MAG: ABC transporter ATP-binding protein [Planctomycetota bacterium]
MDGPDDKATLRTALRDIWRIIGFLKPFKKQFLTLLLIVTAMNIATLARPYIVGWGINHLEVLLEEGKPTLGEKLTYVGIPVGLYLVFGIVTALLMRVRPVAVWTLGVALLRRLRTMVYNKAQRLSFNYLDRLTNGQIIERATGDAQQIQNFLTMSFVQVFDATVTIGVMLVFMFAMNVELALVVLAPFPLVMVVFAMINRRIRIRQREARDQVDVMTTRLAEGIAGVKVIRSFGTAEQMSDQYRGALVELFRRSMRVGVLRAFGLQGVFRVSHLIRALLVLYGGLVIIRGSGYLIDESVRLGFFITYLFYVQQFIMKVQPLMQAGSSAQVARVSFERIIALMEAEPDVVEADDAAKLPPGGGSVEFRNVSFAYQTPPDPESDVTERMVIEVPPSTPPAIRDVSLTVDPGEVVALVGPTGSGKTTVVSLLPRFYNPTEGRILIDGKDIRQVRLDDLRRNIAMVFQETFLFRGTIAENIAYGLPDVHRYEIHKAARLAQAEDFIKELPMGYNAPVGERGVTLSGGQRQRLAIARAILMKPRVLILDDATASVDATTEYKIRQGLKELMAERTTFIIAHRLATIRAADRIVVLNEGRVEDVGTHDALLERNEFYQTLYESQMAEQRDGEDSV